MDDRVEPIKLTDQLGSKRRKKKKKKRKKMVTERCTFGSLHWNCIVCLRVAVPLQCIKAKSDEEGAETTTYGDSLPG
jgi:hypothetical protein